MLPHFVFVFVFFLVFVSVFVFLFVFFSLALLGVNFVVNALLFATKTTKISFLTFFFLSPLAKRSTCNKSNATVKRSNT